MSTGSGIPPFALHCDMTVFSPEERTQHLATITQMLSAVQEVRPMLNGYTLRFRPETNVLHLLAHFIDGERRCCPFLNFQLEMEPTGPLWLRLTGSGDVKEFLRMEFGGLAEGRLQFD